VANPPDDQLDYRFSLANERTQLAWVRTALALIAGGIAAAKALHFDHELLRWIVAVPPIVAGTWMAASSHARRRDYESAMRTGQALPVGEGSRWLAIAVSAYALVALAATILDG
jgi:putative membrane protein